MVRDPVCGISLEIGHALRASYHGTPYYFCSHDCKVNFEDRPEEYAHAPEAHLIEAAAAPINNLVSILRAGATDH
jgi:YHS domain-containing protein